MTMCPSIKTEHEYAAALEAIEQLLEAEPGTPCSGTLNLAT